MDENQNNAQTVEATTTETKEKKDVKSVLKSFNLLTLIGAGLVIFFLLFMFVTPVTIRWWLMVPVAIGAGVCFEIGRRTFEGQEKKICFIGIIVIAALFLVRDMYVSAKFVESRIAYSAAKDAIDSVSE